MQFYHDLKTDVLVYPGHPPSTQALPDARMINGSYFGVPRTLTNCQVLRYYNYPVPAIMDGYDWPIEPGRKPLAHQIVMANFSVLHRRMFNLSDMGCVAGETEIDTAGGKRTIASLAYAARPFFVRSLTNDGLRFIRVESPFIKGFDKLYRVRFKSGRSIVVTKRHVFMTSRGWVSCENLAVDAQLPVFDVYPPQSIWEPCHVRLMTSAQRLFETTANYSGCFDTLFYDEPPLSVVSIVPDVAPSLSDAPRRIRFGWQTDARGNKYTRSVRFAGDLPSNSRCGVQIDQGEMGAFLSEYATRLTDNQFHIFSRYHLFPSPQQATPQGRELRLCIPVSEASGSPFDTVTHITYERDDVYYDMHVPEHENYVAHGLCNHNTMKTLSTLWAADWLMQQHPKGTFRALIVAPLSTLERVWANAIFKNFLSRRSFEILHGDANARAKNLAKPADFYIVNFDGVGVGAHTRKRFELDGFSKALAERQDIRLCICDEASAYKDSRTKRHRIARLVIGRREYLWLLTGTPTPNAPTDAYGLAKLVNNAFGKSFQTFQAESMLKVSNFRWVPQKDGYDKARKLLTPSIRYDLKDIWDGPEMTTQQRQVELTDQQKKLMAELKRDLMVQVKQGQPITATNEAAARQKFIQISLGAVYDAGHVAHAVDAKPRLAELKSILEQAPGKCIIFSPLTSVVNMLYRELKAAHSCEVVNGPVSPKERNRIFEAFQRSGDSDPRILIADPGTMAHGLDLWQARTIIWYGTCESTEEYLQANRRAYRPGQKYPVTVVQIVSNKLEQEIYRRLESNISLQGALLEMVRRNEL